MAEPVQGQTTASELGLRYDLLVESIRNYAIFVIDVHGRIESWNRGAKIMNGHDASEIVGRHISVLYASEDVSSGKCEFELRKAATEGVVDTNGWRIRKDGSRFWANTVLSAIRDESGRLLCFANIWRDLSGQRAAEEELERSREKFRLLVDSVREYAIFMLDSNGIIETWSPGAQIIKGYRPEEIIGRHIETFYTPEDQAAGQAQQLLSRAVTEGRVEDEGWRIRKDGSRFWANVVITALHDASGMPCGFAKVTRDLTERRKTEEDLRRSEDRFRLLLDGVKDYAIFMLDPSGRITMSNAGAERIKGLRASDIIGRHVSVFYTEEDVRNRKWAEELRIAADAGRYEEEGWRVRQDGSKFWANVVITALREPGGGLLGFVKITRDLTDRRRLDEERIALAHAQEAIRLRDEFLSIASHELKTPLTALQLQLHALRDRFTGDEQLKQKLVRAVRSGERLAQLIEGLLDVARIRSGWLALETCRFDLAVTAAQVIENLQETSSRAGCEVRLHAEGPVFGVWDLPRMEQVLSNLITNAIKYGPGAPVDVAIRKHNDDVVLEISDHGSGIPENDLTRIFGRFERAVSMRHHGGLGLGLYVAREIVLAHGGSIAARNVPDGGACFTVTLPVETPRSGHQTHAAK